MTSSTFLGRMTTLGYEVMLPSQLFRRMPVVRSIYRSSVQIVTATLQMLSLNPMLNTKNRLMPSDYLRLHTVSPW